MNQLFAGVAMIVMGIVLLGIYKRAARTQKEKRSYYKSAGEGLL